MYIPGQPGKPGVLVFSRNATRAEVLEEIKHLRQHKSLKFVSLSTEQIILLEIEAQQQLSRYAKMKGWSDAEIKQFDDNLDYWKAKQAEYAKGGDAAKAVDAEVGGFRMNKNHLPVLMNKIVTTAKTLQHEAVQAKYLVNYLGGGEFTFDDFKEGIEGFLRQGTTFIPISLKEYNTANIKNIFRRIKDNSDHVISAAATDSKIIIGSNSNTILYVESTEFSSLDIINHISLSTPNILPPKNVFSRVLFKGKDNFIINIPLQ